MDEQKEITRSEEKDSPLNQTTSLETENDKPSESVEVPAPHQEQQRYWGRDLFYKKVSLGISVGGFILIAFGLWGNYSQIKINTEQLRLNTEQSARVEKSNRANVQNFVLNHVLSLDKVFMEKPYLKPYFYEGKNIDVKDEKYLEVTATAEMVLDVFDMIIDQRVSFSEYWDKPTAWDEWMIDFFSTSPILQETFDKYSNWYDESLKAIRIKGKERALQKTPQKQP